KKSARKCCVNGCQSRESEKLNISFHSFPKANSSFAIRKNLFNDEEVMDRRKLWMQQLKINSKSDVSSMMVCSKHFNKNDYYLPEYENLKKILLRSAIPTQNLSFDGLNEKGSKKRNLDREGRLQHRVQKKLCSKREEEVVPAILETYDMSVIDDNIINGDLMIPKQDEKKNDCNCYDNVPSQEITLTTEEALHDFDMTISDEILRKDVEVQVNCGDMSLPFISIITTDKSLISLCGTSYFSNDEIED
ncbi:hypothetical protein PV328_011806, partial [Microctonus aethiopoides]